jgi:hypothetical protein
MSRMIIVLPDAVDKPHLARTLTSYLVREIVVGDLGRALRARRPAEPRRDAPVDRTPDRLVNLQVREYRPRLPHYPDPVPTTAL